MLAMDRISGNFPYQSGQFPSDIKVLNYIGCPVTEYSCTGRTNFDVTGPTLSLMINKELLT